MKISKVKTMKPLDRLVYWITERESIRLKKEAGESRPWTDDEILDTYRFCNVRRMDDRVSQWLLKNWYEPYRDHPNAVLACVLARHFNQPSTLELIGYPTEWNPDEILHKIEKSRAECKPYKGPIFNSAYYLSSELSIRAGELGVTRVHTVLGMMCQQFVDRPFTPTNTVRESITKLTSYRGVGTFIAGQIVADLRWATSINFKDRLRWAAIGPGSRRGMNRLLGKDVKASMNQELFDELFSELVDELKEKLPTSITRRLEAIDLQGVLCEFDKYERITKSEGKLRKYKHVVKI